MEHLIDFDLVVPHETEKRAKLTLLQTNEVEMWVRHLSNVKKQRSIAKKVHLTLPQKKREIKSERV